MEVKPSQGQRQSIRLKNYRYTQPGAYFVTLCTHGRECWLGRIQVDQITLSEVGQRVQQHWQDLPNRFENIALDTWVIMPNHLHGIIQIHPLKALGVAPTLGDIVRAFKSCTAIAANKVLGRSGQAFWQRNYWERIVRNEAELQALREYIHNNPKQWELDSLYQHPYPFSND